MELGTEIVGFLKKVSFLVSATVLHSVLQTGILLTYCLPSNVKFE